MPGSRTAPFIAILLWRWAMTGRAAFNRNNTPAF